MAGVQMLAVEVLAKPESGCEGLFLQPLYRRQNA